ncbi:MAG: acyl-CoA dehydrogenase [Deltaproteobacteria bacterium]|nr:acyl-CoA dehydrogenase [Deltaproteobacteria bacterium]
MAFAVDKRDIEFCLFEYLKMEDLFKTEKYADFDREAIEMVLDLTIKLATDKIAPLNIVMDREGIGFDKGKVTTPEGYKEAYQALCDAGLVAAAHNPEYGGMGLPHLMATAIGEIMSSASVAFAMNPGLGATAGEVIEVYGTEEMKKLYLEKLFTGEWGGTMCLTESGAGSAVGDLKTKAKKEGDHWLIEGEKIFISAGDHDLTDNIVHLVLARTEGAPKGIKGISLFAVPKVLVNDDGSLADANNVICGNIEHKMGIKGSPTCTMVFGADGPSHGWLIGEESKGIKYMFLMMNEARIGVGLQGQSTAAASYQEALQYAAERIQGVDIAKMKDVDAPRLPIIEHPDVRRMLLTMKAFTEGMRALLYSTAYFSDLMEVHEDENERKNYNSMMELMTPICKSYCSDYGFRMTELGIQILGGYGYTIEYPQEQYCRDAKIASIYEGTNGIQALDLIGRKMTAKGGLFFMTYLTRVNDFINSAKEHARLGEFAGKLEKARDSLVQVAMSVQQAGMSGDIYTPVLNATPFMDLFGTIVMAYHLLEMAVVADEKLEAIYAKAGAEDKEAQTKIIEENPEAKYYDGKLHSARFFIDAYLPHTMALAKTITSGNKSPLEIVF